MIIQDPLIIGTEVIFSAIIIILCSIIYWKTREMFKLTKHKGIAYFRQTFLFLALAYLFRFVSSMVKLSFFLNGDITRFFGMPFLLVAFFSTMALLSLFMSVTWKKLEWKHWNHAAPIIATVIMLISIIFREPLILMSMQIFLLVSTGIIGFHLHEESKNIKKILGIYILIFLFWILSLNPLSSHKFLPTETILIIHALSLGLFVTIFYKVNKWIK